MVFFSSKSSYHKFSISYLVGMFVVVNKYVLAKHFEGIVLWPFIFVKRRELKGNVCFMNHERIHLRQQLELLVLPFFIWYLIEYLIRLVQYRNSYKAYTMISFEREAYRHEKEVEYLRRRRLWAFWKYL